MATKSTHRPPTHLPLVFAHSTWMQRAHIASAPQPENGEDLMMIVRKGEQQSVTYTQAVDLIIAETAVDARKADNKDRIDEIRQEAIEDTKRAEREAKRTPAKHETTTEMIERIATSVGESIARALSGGKKAVA